MKSNLTRRQFITAASTASAAISSVKLGRPSHTTLTGRATGKLAILGGQPVRKQGNWPSWPYVDERVEEKVLETARSRIWCRIQSSSGTVPTFEKHWAKLMGSNFCVTTGSGTQALHTCVEALGIGPGDEVITSPYTDPGTIASILSARALPILADLDPESYQLDPADIERKIGPNTRAIMPVHMMGQPCDLDSIEAIARKHDLRIIEDAAQGHLAVHRGRKLGTVGDLGCFSFQSSKTLACGEGGAIVGNDEALMDRCFTVHNHGTSRRGRTEVGGPKYRMNEFEAAALLGQLDGLEERFLKRNRNAAFLTERIKNIPGLTPQKLYPGTESGSFYIYAMSYHREHFNDADRDTFLRAVSAEGADLSPYIAQGLHREPWVDHILGLKVYQKMYPPERLAEYRDLIDCPNCDRVCREMAMIWASGPLLAEESDMQDIVDAIQKVYENRDQLHLIPQQKT